MLLNDVKFNISVNCILEVMLFRITGKNYEVTYDQAKDVYDLWLDGEKKYSIKSFRIYHYLCSISDYLSIIIRKENL